MSNQVDKKEGDNNAKLIREKRFEISPTTAQAHHVCFRSELLRTAQCTVMKRYSFNPQQLSQTRRKCDTDVTITLNFFGLSTKKFGCGGGFPKLNNALER